MNEEVKYFDYTNEPGKKRNIEISINDGKPLISIITAYYNCKEYIQQTANSVFNQTFPYWEWIIVNDGSTEEGTKEILEELEKRDSRIKVYNQENKGRIVSRDVAISHTNSDIIYMLDSDDVLDPTLFECGYWTLYTNPKASWAYTNCVNFGEEEFLYKPYFNSEQEKFENLCIGSAFIRKKELLEVGGYNVVDKDVHEDWHLWLRMLEKGYYPVKMNFYGFWYRKRKGSTLHNITANKKRERYVKQVIKEQADKITGYIKAIQYPLSTEEGYDSYPEIFEWDRKAINIKGQKKNILFIFPWFVFGGADKFNLDLISRLDKNSYNITIITTEPLQYIWRQKFEQHATIFDVTTFLHRKNWASFIYYIIKSRNIDLVMLSNSYYGYYVQPWLKACFPEVIFTDYIHAHDWSWRNGAYPRDSIAISNLLDKTYTCNNFVRETMIKHMRAKDTEKLETVYVGVDSDEFSEKAVVIDKQDPLLEQIKNKKVILFICRIVELKRPMFILRVLKRILEQDKDYILLVVGDGENLNEMKSYAQLINVKDNVIFMGMQENVKKFYKLANVSVVCSLTEGLAITVYESLSMSVPVVSSDVGGHKELIDDSCGRIIPLMQNVENDLYNRDYSKKEIEDYVKAILDITKSSQYSEIRKQCRKKIVEGGFSVNNMVKKMDESFTNLITKGTSVKYELANNKELAERYLVLYNVLDARTYNNPIAGKVDVKINMKIDMFLKNLKGKLWGNPLYRGLVKFLQKTGIMGKLKNKRNKKKIEKLKKMYE